MKSKTDQNLNPNFPATTKQEKNPVQENKKNLHGKSSKEIIRIKLPYPTCTGNKLYTRTKNGNRLSDLALEYYAQVRNIIQHQNARFDISERFFLKMYITPKMNRKRDTDNFSKVIGDALTRSGFWRDDSLANPTLQIFLPPNTSDPHILIEILPVPTLEALQNFALD